MSCPLPDPLPAEPGATLEDRAHTAYQNDFGPACPLAQFQTGQVKVSRRPHIANPAREHSYWHTVTFGFPEDTRVRPDKIRLRRVPWVHPILTGVI